MPRDEAAITLATRDGVELRCFEDISIHESFTDPLGSYRFTVGPQEQDWATITAKLKKGELVAIKLDGRKFATPIITTVEKKLGEDGPVLEVECKSVLCTPYEGYSNPDMAKKWKEDVSVDQVVSDILEQYGFDELVTDSTAHANALTGKPLDGRAAPVNLKALTLRELQGQESETAYQIMSRVFMRLGCAVHVNHQGSVLICRPDYDQASAYSLVQDSDFSHSGDRILLEPAAALHDSNDGLYSEVVVRGQQPDDDGITALGLPVARVGESDDNRPVGAPYGKVPLAPLKYTKHGYESTVARFKPRYAMDKDCRDAKACRAMARTIYGNRAKDAFWMTCSIQGFIAMTGRAWAPNTIADVYVEAWDFQERLWVMDRTFEQSKDGRRTDLRLIARGALSIGADE